MMPHPIPSSRPLVAITADLMIRKNRPTAYSTMTYASAVTQAGGIPVILPPTDTDPHQLIARFDAFIFSGGDDPKTEPFGCPTHPSAVPVLDQRQLFETNLLSALDEHPQVPILAICLGMQMLALCNGGHLNQHLPDTHKSHELHWGHTHEIAASAQSTLDSGQVYSMHRQAIDDPGTLRVIATAPDGVIEAIDDPSRSFTLGVQWHPERTENPSLGSGLFDQLVNAAKHQAN